MIKKLLFTFLFCLIASSAWAIRVGDVDGFIDDTWAVIYDSGELTEACTDLTVSGLEGDADETYNVISRVVNGYSGASGNQLRLCFGSPTTAKISGYGQQIMYGNNSSAVASRGTAETHIRIGLNDAIDKISFSDAIINVSEDLSKTAIVDTTMYIDGTTVGYIVNRGYVCDEDDEVTGINFHASAANGFGIGSRFILLKKCPSDVGMRVGDLEVLGDINGWNLLTEVDVTEACTDLTLSGLDGDTDVIYRLSANLSNSNATPVDYRMRFNGDGNTGNYGRQYLAGVNATVECNRTNNKLGAEINVGAVAQNSISFFDVCIYAKSGYERTALSKAATNISGTTVSQCNTMGHSWNNTGDEIVSISLNATETNGIGAGSTIRLYKLKLEE